MNSSPATYLFVQRLTRVAAARARFPSTPLGRLMDPLILDRLNAPLTRFRD